MDFKSFENDLANWEKDGVKRALPDFDPNKIANLSSNDYLGLSLHPLVKQAVGSALEISGVGGTSSRLLAGTSNWHQELETSLASFLNKEAALVFSSGYHVNTGLLPALADAGDMIFVDKLCHASLLDGIRLSKARFCSFDHNNPDHLEGLLQKRRNSYRRAFIVTEGIFSMDGDFGMLPEIVFLAKKWNAYVYLDEAHSFGLLGKEGKGLAEHLNLLKDVDIFVGTLSKALGSQGGFVATSRAIVETLITRARSFIYTTALSPLCAAAATAGLGLLPKMEKERERLRTESALLRKNLNTLGYNTMKSQSQIVPVWTGDIPSTKKLSNYLLTAGYFVPSIRPPTVPVGESRIRLSITVDVLNQGWEKLLNTFSTYPDRKQEARETIGQTT